jgi:hypothetical protein
MVAPPAVGRLIHRQPCFPEGQRNRNGGARAGLLVEMVLIAAAVVLGFAATEWGERRRNVATGAEALSAITRELAARASGPRS